MRAKIEELLRANGIENQEMIDNLEQDGFFAAPASTSHHLACEGGLAEHTYNVMVDCIKLAMALDKKELIPSLVKIALLHDAGKMGITGAALYKSNLLKSGKVSEAKPYVQDPTVKLIPHEVRSIMWAAKHCVPLTDDETRAIMWHNGLYGPFKYDISGHEDALYLILHSADMWASRIDEGGDE